MQIGQSHTHRPPEIGGWVALVLNDGTAYEGGEYRPNQNEFDDACRRLSQDRVRLGAAAGLNGALGLLPFAVITRHLSRAAQRRSAAGQQSRQPANQAT